MSNHLSMAKSSQIHELYQQGWSQRRIARELGIDRESVRRHLWLGEATGSPQSGKPATVITGTETGEASKPAKVITGSDVENSSKPAPAIGNVANIANTAGISLEEMGAVIAMLTRNGIKTREAITSLRGIIVAFLKPSEEAAKMAKELGFELNVATLQSEGLAGSIKGQ